MLEDAIRLRTAVERVLADCKDGALANLIGCGAMFPGKGYKCVLGHVAALAGGIPFVYGRHKNGRYNYDAISYTELIAANDAAPAANRHLAVIRPLESWLDAINKVIGLLRERAPEEPVAKVTLDARDDRLYQRDAPPA